jgi:RND family efflux transporter MFP subunit
LFRAREATARRLPYVKPNGSILLLFRGRETAASPRAPRVRPKTSFLLLFLVTAMLAGCQDEAVESVVDLVVPVTVQPVGRGTIESFVSTTGSLRASRTASVLVEVRGDLHYVAGAGGRKPVEGMRVQAGQQIARIESPEYVNSIRLESREMAVENARNALAERQALFDEQLAVQSEVQAARKTLTDTIADLENAKIQLEKLNVYAPITGYLTSLVDTTEETIVEANTAIAQVVDYARALVDLRIPNSQMPMIDLGQEVRISNYAFRDQLFPGRITVLDPTLDPTSRTFRIEVAVDNPNLVLRPGMFVKADVVVEQRADVLVIPKQLILQRRGRSVVFVEEAGVAQEREIEIGLQDDVMAEVVDGLAEGERVITSNYETLRSRTQVRVTGESGPRTR